MRWAPILKLNDSPFDLQNSMQSLRKPDDTLISRYLNRPLSLRITPIFLYFHISPNVITTICLIIGLIGIILIGFGNYWLGVLGAILFHVRSILDGCDGEVARGLPKLTPAWCDARPLPPRA